MGSMEKTKTNKNKKTKMKKKNKYKKTKRPKKKGKLKKNKKKEKKDVTVHKRPWSPLVWSHKMHLRSPRITESVGVGSCGPLGVGGRCCSGFASCLLLLLLLLFHDGLVKRVLVCIKH